jgi:hypothetical protein
MQYWPVGPVQPMGGYPARLIDHRRRAYPLRPAQQHPIRTLPPRPRSCRGQPALCRWRCCGLGKGGREWSVLAANRREVGEFSSSWMTSDCSKVPPPTFEQSLRSGSRSRDRPRDASNTRPMVGVERTPPGWNILAPTAQPWGARCAVVRNPRKTDGAPQLRSRAQSGQSGAVCPSLRAAEPQAPGLAVAHATADATRGDATNSPPGIRRYNQKLWMRS